jgi:hypothetical protein
MRPKPPERLLDPALIEPVFEPVPELLAWAIATFIDESAPLHNPDHLHLQGAFIGMLWTNAPNSRHGRSIIGQCEFKPPGGTMGKWARARAQAQILGWFGHPLDFLLTFDAIYAARCSDAEFCALVEHELYHAGQAKDEFGGPKFAESGMPVFCLRGHDIEEFTGVVRRYGAAAAHAEAFIAAAALTADVPAERLAAVCGTCG